MSEPKPSRKVFHPWLSVLIAVSWLLLQGSLAPPHLLWAVILGLGLPWVARAFLGGSAPLRRPVTAGRLVLRVLWDILVANLVVARLVLDPRRTPRPLWVRVRYTVRDARGVMLLATIITTTPGTVSCVVNEERGEILVHALDADDAAAVEADILARYDAPLKEIFG